MKVNINSKRKFEFEYRCKYCGSPDVFIYKTDDYGVSEVCCKHCGKITGVGAPPIISALLISFPVFLSFLFVAGTESDWRYLIGCIPSVLLWIYFYA